MKLPNNWGDGIPNGHFSSPREISSTRNGLYLIKLLTPTGTLREHKLLLRLLVVLHKLMVSRIAEDNTRVTHRTWRSQAGAYREPPFLQISIHGTGRYSACYQSRKVNTSLATSPLVYMVSYLQDVLVQQWHRACGCNQLMSYFIYGP